MGGRLLREALRERGSASKGRLFRRGWVNLSWEQELRLMLPALEWTLLVVALMSLSPFL